MKKNFTELYFALAFDLRRTNSGRSREALEKLYYHVPQKPKLQHAIAETLAGEYKTSKTGGA